MSATVMAPVATDDAPSSACGITLLQASGRRLCKRLKLNGELEDAETSKHFDLCTGSIPAPGGLRGLYTLLRTASAKPDVYAVRGEPIDPTRTSNVRRVVNGPEATLRDVARSWLALDLDDVPLPANVDETDLTACWKVALHQLPEAFHRARCIVQATGGHGIKPGARLRVWVWLSRPITCAEAKSWLVGVKIDQSLNNPGQPIFTASPLREDGGPDHIPQRLVWVDGEGEVKVPKELRVPLAPARASGTAEASVEDVSAALAIIPPMHGFPAWNRIGMACWASTGGSLEGREAFAEWSALDPAEAEGADAARTRWAAFDGCPPTAIGFGALAAAAEAAQPGWMSAVAAREFQALEPMPVQLLRRIEIAETVEAQAPARPVHRPIVRVEPGEIASAVDRAQVALIEAEAGVFQRGGVLGSVISGQGRTSGGEPLETLRFQEIGDEALAEKLALAAEFEAYDERKRDYKRIDPPLPVVRTLRQRGQWCLPVLAGFITAPTLRQDGSVLSVPGYDEASGLCYQPSTTSYPLIPENPTRAAAEIALARLQDLIYHFPFVSATDRSVALAMLLTACVRRSLPSAPMFAITATAAGTGKSLLVDLAAILATGKRAPVIAQGRTEEETEKRLGTELLEGSSIINIDNVRQELGGDVLCQMLTQPEVKTRVLGKSVAPICPTQALVCTTGNQLRLVEDLGRRTLLCRLDARLERPELRQFPRSDVELATRERGEFVAAALIIMRAWHLQGAQPNRPPLGSFEAWCHRVRDALVWLGEADAVDSLEETRDTDPKLEAHRAIIAMWRTIIGADAVTTSALIDSVNGLSRSPSVGEPLVAEFRTALAAVGGVKGSLDPQRLGRWLASVAGRRCEGFSIEVARVVHKVKAWHVVAAETTKSVVLPE